MIAGGKTDCCSEIIRPRNNKLFFGEVLINSFPKLLNGKMSTTQIPLNRKHVIKYINTQKKSSEQTKKYCNNKNSIKTQPKAIIQSATLHHSPFHICLSCIYIYKYLAQKDKNKTVINYFACQINYKPA